MSVLSPLPFLDAQGELRTSALQAGLRVPTRSGVLLCAACCLLDTDDESGCAADLSGVVKFLKGAGKGFSHPCHLWHERGCGGQ